MALTVDDQNEKKLHEAEIFCYSELVASKAKHYMIEDFHILVTTKESIGQASEDFWQACEKAEQSSRQEPYGIQAWYNKSISDDDFLDKLISSLFIEKFHARWLPPHVTGKAQYIIVSMWMY